MDTPQKRASRLAVTLLALSSLILSQVPVQAQINTYVRAIRSGQAREGAPLRVAVELSKSTDIGRVVLYYRQFGQTEFRILEMQISGDTASATISEDEVTPPFMETYVMAQTATGAVETFPFENPQATPTRIPIAAKSPKDQEIMILSPDKSEPVTPSDIYVSISFVYAGSQVDQKRTKVIFDNVDVSALAVSIGELLIVSADALPKNITTGPHNLSVLVFDTTGAPYHSLERTFSVVSEGQAEATAMRVEYAGNAQAEGRNENIKGTVTQYKRLSTNANASYGILKANGNMLLTSEEQSDRQPQNRYFLGLDAKYLRVGLGDAYPRFPTAVLDGRRIRGVTADLLLGAFNLNYAGGEIIRRVDADSSQQRFSPTLKRTLTAIRPSFGKGENFQIGFSYLKAKDDFDSSRDRNVKPQENVVLGSDALIAFDDHRFEITGQTSLSLNNVDVSVPQYSDDSVEAAVNRGSISRGDGDNIKKYLPYLSKLILWNENLQPLNPTGLTSLVYETGIALNYFGNYLKGTYVYHGADYTSVGTTALRKDIKGFNIFDRVRLFENHVFLTGGYERLENIKSDTLLTNAGLVELKTTYQTINTSVSYYPSTNMPNITVGYGLSKNTNPLSPSDTSASVAPRAIDDNTTRMFLQSTYDFTYWGRHNATLSVDVSNKTDNTTKRQDVKSMNAFLLVNTVHTFPLESAFGYSMSLNTIPQVTVDTTGGVTKILISSTTLDYTTISINGRYKLYKDILKLSATLAPTFGDFKRTVLEASLQYLIARNQSASFQYQYIINSAPPPGTVQTSDNDSYLSLIYRIDL